MNKTKYQIKEAIIFLYCLFFLLSANGQLFTKVDSFMVNQSPYSNMVVFKTNNTNKFLCLSSGKANQLYLFNRDSRNWDSIRFEGANFMSHLLMYKDKIDIIDDNNLYSTIQYDSETKKSLVKKNKTKKNQHFDLIVENKFSSFLISRYNYFIKNKPYSSCKIVATKTNKKVEIPIGNQIILSYYQSNLVAINDSSIYFALPKDLKVIVFNNQLKIIDTIVIKKQTLQNEYALITDSLINYNKLNPKELIDIIFSNNIDFMEQIENILLYKQNYLLFIIKNPSCKWECKRIVLYDLINKKTIKDYYQEQISGNTVEFNTYTDVVYDSLLVDVQANFSLPDSLGSYMLNLYKVNFDNLDTTFNPNSIIHLQKQYLDTISKTDLTYKSISPEPFLHIQKIKKKLVDLNNDILLDYTIQYKGIIFANGFVCKSCFDKLDFKDYIIVLEAPRAKEFRKYSLSYFEPIFKNGTFIFNNNTFIKKGMYNKIYNILKE